jgi:hypothetical protein
MTHASQLADLRISHFKEINGILRCWSTDHEKG